MTEPKAGGRQSRDLATTIGAFLVAHAFGVFLASRHVRHALVWTDDALFRAFSGFPAAQFFMHQALEAWSRVFGASYFVILFVASIAAPLGFVARMIARARVRAGHHDPIERLRASLAAHPRGALAALAVPALGWGVLLTRFLTTFHDASLFVYGPPAIVGLLAVLASERKGVRMLVAPTFDEAPRIEIRPDEIVFDAVAVTRETQAAIALLALLSVTMTAWIASAPLARLFTDARILGGVGAYVAVAFASAALFRKASRVAVGIDGVRVYGTSRTRFFPYADIDEARAIGGDLALVRRDRIVLRLQLHGADAARRQAVLDRVDRAITRAKAERHDAATHFVASASRDELARAVQGGGDYRTTSLSRDQLWAVVEGPAIASGARAAAAEALAKTNDAIDRARLRVAATQCADPRVRVAMARLVDESEAEELERASPEARAQLHVP